MSSETPAGVTNAPAAEELPWHQAQWRAVARALKADRLPHAWLIHGGAGLGKRRFARVLAQVLLCPEVKIHAQALAPCGRCASCRQFAAGLHPDFLELQPEEDSREIKIDQVRELIGRLQLSKHHGLRKVALLDPAEALNRNAADALLKTLEEPPPGTHLLLIGERIGLLSATLRSRCQRLSFIRPDASSALAWLSSQGLADAQYSLAAAEGAPLRAQALAGSDVLNRQHAWDQQLAALICGKGDLVQVADSWSKEPAQEWLSWLDRSCRQALQHKLSSARHSALAALPWLRLMALSAKLVDMYKMQNKPVRWPWQIEGLLGELLEPV
ncbi:MAG: DNA polymerase III subunit delta' [Nevskiales bacterium]